MPEIVNIHSAKTHLSQLLGRVMKGEEIVIAKAGKPIARLVPERPGFTSLEQTRISGIAEIPEPAYAPCVGLGLGLFAVLRRRRRV